MPVRYVRRHTYIRIKPLNKEEDNKELRAKCELINVHKDGPAED